MAMSGEQWTISYAGFDAVIVGVGGGLRSFTLDGRPYLHGYEDDEIAPGSAGQVLAPWPGRIADGAYVFENQTLRLPWNDPENRCALHGLVRWLRWQAADVTDSSVTVECALPAQPGYPFPLVLRTRWSVGPYGLRAVHTVSNVGSTPCPFGLGIHPYLMLPDGDLSQWQLRVPAKSQLVSDARNLPTGEVIPATFTEPTAIGTTVLDTTFGELDRDSDGNASVTLGSADGTQGVSVWFDDAFGWLQLFTGDTLDADRRRRAVAVEPMTCPPDALRSGTDLVTLAPGEMWSGTWGIMPRK